MKQRGETGLMQKKYAAYFIETIQSFLLLTHITCCAAQTVIHSLNGYSTTLPLENTHCPGEPTEGGGVENKVAIVIVGRRLVGCGPRDRPDGH